MWRLRGKRRSNGGAGRRRGLLRIAEMAGMVGAARRKRSRPARMRPGMWFAALGAAQRQARRRAAWRRARMDVAKAARRWRSGRGPVQLDLARGLGRSGGRPAVFAVARRRAIGGRAAPATALAAVATGKPRAHLPGRTFTVVGAAIAGAAAVLVATRQPALRGSRPIRGFATKLFDPAVTRLGLVGGRRSPYAMLEHRGRKSGRVYRTPILPLATATGFAVNLPYGRDAQWVQNILAAGGGRLQLHESVYELDQPTIVPRHDLPQTPGVLGSIGRRSGIEYLVVRTVAARPGVLEPVAPIAGSGAMAPAGG